MYLLELNNGKETRDNVAKNFWVAELLGNGTEYKYNRKFISTRDISSSSSNHKYFVISAKLEENKIYEVADCGERRFVKVVENELVTIDKNEISF